MQRSKTKQLATRWVVYLVGMFVLAAGLTLNTKTGLGTILSMLCIGRYISLFNKFFRRKLRLAAGLEQPAAV